MKKSDSRRCGALVAALALLVACTAPAPLPDPLQAGWKGQLVCEKLHEDVHNRVLRCTFPAGVGHERHFHPPHFGYAISGGRVQIADDNGVREVDLVSGSSFASDGVAWHEVTNVGDSTIIYLIIEPK